MKNVVLPLRMLLRDWRAGELRVLAAALVVAVASITSVGFFADRVRQALTREAHQLLGADLVLTADHPWQEPMRSEIARRGLRVAQSSAFISMARRGEEAQLASIKAVSSAYPLRGRLRIAPALNAPDRDTGSVPAPGTVWLDERLALALAARVGDSIELGRAPFKVDAILTLEPDRGVSFFNIAPRLLMRLQDVPATGLIQSGSRVWYSLLAAGDPEAVAAFQRWAQPRLGRGESLQSIANARPEIRASLDRAEHFIGLTALLAVILAAVAISLATRRYSERHLDGYAVMRCLGATQARLFSLFAWEFGALALAACAAGCVAGYGAQLAIAWLLADLIAVNLPPPSLVPALQGLLIGVTLLLGFALPPLLTLKNVPALRVIRRDVGPPRQGALAAYGLGLATMAALLAWQAGDARLGLIVLSGFAGAFVVFSGLAYAALNLLGSLAIGAGSSWRYGLASLRRRSRTNTVQIIALALGIAAILLLSFTREDLLATWRAKLPPDAPNRFIVNIQPEQLPPLAEFFAQNGMSPPETYPMVRGRYVAINGIPVEMESFDERGRRLAEREFNLSYLAEIPRHNRLAAGRWFDPRDLERGAFSVEEGIARTLGWKVGDTLTWQVAGKTVAAPIVGLRKLDWDSMRVNFFVIATPALLREAPQSFVTSFHLGAGQAPFANAVARRFPNMTVIDMSAILRQAEHVMEIVIRAVQLVFLFALGAGILVLYAALLATQDERTREAAVMRALGATRARVIAAQRAEFVVLGLLAGAIAALAAAAIGFVIAREAFQFPYRVNHWIWLAGPALGLGCVAINAIAGARAALSRPPIVALREV